MSDEPYIRQLTTGDADVLLTLLDAEPEYTLFFRGNWEVMGFSDPRLEYWGAFAGEQLVQVLMRYGNNWTAYGPEESDYAVFAQIMDSHPAGVRFITGKPGIVDQLAQLPSDQRIKHRYSQYFCRLHELVDPPSLAAHARRAGLNDTSALLELYKEDDIQRTEDQIRRALQERRVWVVEIDGTVVSTAMTTAETSRLAMIGGVFTPPSLRRRGYATACMYGLCRNLLTEGKHPCLFYHNPAAGNIYRHLGFQDIGPWAMVEMEKTVACD